MPSYSLRHGICRMSQFIFNTSPISVEELSTASSHRCSRFTIGGCADFGGFIRSSLKITKPIYCLIEWYHSSKLSLSIIEGTKLSSSASEASRERIQRPHEFLAPVPPRLLHIRAKEIVRRSPCFRRCSNVTRSVQRRLWPSVESERVGHSEPPVKGNRLRSLELLWDLFLQVPTQKQEALPSTSGGWVSPIAVGWGNSQSQVISCRDENSSCTDFRAPTEDQMCIEISTETRHGIGPASQLSVTQ